MPPVWRPGWASSTTCDSSLAPSWGSTPETPDDPPDERDPTYRLWVEYLYLTWIEGQLIEVASAALPDA